MNLHDIQAKRCFTVVGCLVEHNKILLVHHVMLNLWMSPGGHVEKNELPHKAAEREFFEETGIPVKAISSQPMFVSDESEFLPLPIYSNLHWINRPGENKRSPNTGKRCEQHYVFTYYVKRNGKQKKTKDNGVKGIGWFGKKDLANLPMSKDLRMETEYILNHYPQKDV